MNGPFSQLSSSPYGHTACDPFPSPYSPSVDPFHYQFFQNAGHMMTDMLERKRILARDRRIALEERARKEKDEEKDITEFTHQSSEVSSGKGQDGRIYSREENCFVDSSGAKKHIIVCTIDDKMRKTSTWSVKTGEEEGDQPHIITYSGVGDNLNTRQNEKTFEKCWTSNCPFLKLTRGTDV